MDFNLADLWERVADTVPDREAVVCGDRRLTYAQLEARANRLAHHLASVGVGVGDHVALDLYNGTEYLEGMLAAFKLRAVPINVNYRYGEDELRYLLDDADARVVIHHRELAPTIGAVRDELPLLQHALEVDDASDAASLPGAASYEEALASAPDVRDFGPRSPDDLYLLYTGGTTGMPKGVMWRAEDAFFRVFGGGNLGGAPIEEPGAIVESFDLRRRALPLCPLMHGTGQWMAVATLFAGGTVVMSPDRRFDPARVWELLAREHVNFLVFVGDVFARPLIEAYDELEPRPDTGVDRRALRGSGPVALGEVGLGRSPPRHARDRRVRRLGDRRSGPERVGSRRSCRHVARASCSTTRRPWSTTSSDRSRRVSWDASHVGATCPSGTTRTRSASATTFPVVDGVRWSVPGDHARLEDDGTITVLGRGSVSINTGGEKVYPEEVESVLKSHPHVFDVVVVGVPDERWGERVAAVVQPRRGTTPTLDDLVEHLRGQLAPYKAPRDLVIVDRIMRSASGKADYRWAHDHATGAISE